MHSRIRATKKQKALSLLAFPLYMLCYVPITAAALVTKPSWKPIAHSAATVEELLSKSK